MLGVTQHVHLRNNNKKNETNLIIIGALGEKHLEHYFNTINIDKLPRSITKDSFTCNT